MMEEMDNRVRSSRLTNMVEEATNMLLEMNAKDVNRLEGQAWLDEQNVKGISNSTGVNTNSSALDNNIQSEVEQEIAQNTPKNRLHINVEESDSVLEESEDSTENIESEFDVEGVEEGSVLEQSKVIVAHLKPLAEKSYKKIELVDIKPAKKIEENPTEAVESTVSSEAVEEKIEKSAQKSTSDTLTENQQNIKTVFEQIMETERANRELSAIEFINYCIVQTRNTFGLKTTLQSFDFHYGTPDVIVSKAQEKWSEIELVKYYLQYLLEEAEFLRYLEPKDELLLPKIEARVLYNNFDLKDIPVVESKLEVYSSFTREREYDIRARLLKISADMSTGHEIINALRDYKGGVTITVDGKSKLPRESEAELRKSRLAYAKFVGNDIQEQLVTVDSLKFDGEERIVTRQNDEEVAVVPEVQAVDSGQEVADEDVNSFWNQWTGSEQEKEETPVVEEMPAVDEVQIEKIQVPLESETSDSVEENENLSEAILLDEETCRSLLKFFATGISVDYKTYLRMSREDQEAELILDLQSYVVDMGLQETNKQVAKYSQRIKEIYRPLYEIVTANGYEVENLRDIEDFSELALDNGDFDDKNTIYLYQILVAIKSIWENASLQAEKELEEERLAQEEAERAEKERLAQEEAERAEEERLAQEEAERAEEERLAQEEAERAEEERLAQEESEQLVQEDEKDSGVVDGQPEVTDGSEDDWLKSFESEETVGGEFDIDEEVVSEKKKKKFGWGKKDKTAPDDFEVNLSSDNIIEEEGSEKVNKKVVAGLVVGGVAILGLGGFGIVSFSNHLNGSLPATSQSSKVAERKVNVLTGALDENSEVTFIDKNNSNKLNPNPYSELVLAHSDKVSPEQLKKLGLSEKASLTITDSGKQVAITISGVIPSNSVKDVKISQLKGVDYLKWVDSNNVPYYMPFKL